MSDFDVLNISKHEVKGIISLLAAVLLLGQAGVTVGKCDLVIHFFCCYPIELL